MAGERATIKFEDLNAGEAGKLATRLKEACSIQVPEVKPRLYKQKSRSQDLGTAVQVVLTALPSLERLMDLLKGFTQRQRASISFELPNGKISATDIRTKDAAELARQALRLIGEKKG